MNARNRIAVGMSCVALAASVASADVVPSTLFSDHMVLQREKPVAVWGKADVGEVVTVTFAGQSKQATAGADGKWSVTLDPLTADKSGAALTIAGKNTVTLNDVLVGEVWICSGQSNMEWNLAAARNGKDEVANANHPTMRLFNGVPRRHPSTQPLENVEASWQVCSPDSAKNFSAVGYFFGVKLSEKLDVPIGLINASWGGMPAESFTPVPKLTGPVLQPIVDEWEARLAHYDDDMAKWRADREKWAATTQAATTQPLPREPARPAGINAPNRPGNLWNGMIHPLVPYGIRGAIWYQGESNAGKAEQYDVLFPTMITAWREAFGQGDFPFYAVQLANFMAPTDDPNKASGWARLRESQRLTSLNTKNVGQAVIIDIGEEKDIHPKNKQDVGDRLARLALVETYGLKDVVKQGPTPGTVEFKDGAVSVQFETLGDGLIARGDLAHSFSVADADGKWAWATAKIDGDRVTLTSDSVKEPVAVRYLWADNPTATLFNKTGLPATPFEAKK
ncbi:MAG: sialate O-acetylesterase [Tepidisphaeraceae bacterium]